MDDELRDQYAASSASENILTPVATRQVWQRPMLRLLETRDAETGTNSSTDSSNAIS